jgi:hypothetical protein
MTRTVVQLSLFLFSITSVLFNPRPTQAIGEIRVALPRLAQSHESVAKSSASVLSRVYVADVLDLPIVQQPADNPYYVSDREGEVTQFSMVSQYGNLGLLAHNTLSGRHFSRLATGQEVLLLYEDGKTEHFVVIEILRFQALQPESVSSSFQNLEAAETISAAELFNRTYAGEHRLVFQTCIAADGNPSWGRLFVIAVPKT